MGQEIRYHTLHLHRPSSDHHSNYRKHMCSCRSLACRRCRWLFRDGDWNTFEKVPFAGLQNLEQIGVQKNVLTYTILYLSEGSECDVFVCMSRLLGVWPGSTDGSRKKPTLLLQPYLNQWTTTPKPGVPGVSPIVVARWWNPHLCLHYKWPNEILPISSYIFQFQTNNNSARGSWFGVNYGSTTQGRTATNKFERVVTTADKATTLSRPQVQVAC